MIDGLPMDSPREACGVFGIARPTWTWPRQRSTPSMHYSIGDRNRPGSRCRTVGGSQCARGWPGLANLRRGKSARVVRHDGDWPQPVFDERLGGPRVFPIRSRSPSRPLPAPLPSVTMAPDQCRGAAHGTSGGRSGLNTATDSEVILMSLARRARLPWMENFRLLMEEAEGAYTLVVLTQDGIFGVRDHGDCGPWPWGDGASPTCWPPRVARSLRWEPPWFVRLRPAKWCGSGPAAMRSNRWCRRSGRPSAPLRKSTSPSGQHLRGPAGAPVRQALGRQLALEAPADADWVMSVPDSGTPHAIVTRGRAAFPTRRG